MATSPPEVRAGLEVVTTAATVQIAAAAAEVPPDDVTSTLLEVVRDLVPGLYDAAGALAVAWYDDLRDEASPRLTYDPTIISEPNTDWIAREIDTLAGQLQEQIDADIDAMAERLVAEAEALAQKEIARGFRDTVDGNTKRDPEAIGWSRHTRGAGACKFCVFMARGSVVYRSERAARVAAHTNCHCIARPEFENGQHGPEASVLQYVASQRKRTAKERAALRDHLNRNFPDAPG